MLFGMAVPSWLTNWAYPWTCPNATATPGTCRTVLRTDSGIGLRTASGALIGELGHPPDLEVDLLVDVAEQAGERVMERVGEDERPGDERHAQHNR